MGVKGGYAWAGIKASATFKNKTGWNRGEVCAKVRLRCEATGGTCYRPNTLEAEHGVYAGAWGLDGRVAALESRKRVVVFGVDRGDRLLRRRLLRGSLLECNGLRHCWLLRGCRLRSNMLDGGRVRGWSRSHGALSCSTQGSGGWRGRVLKIGEIAGLFRAGLNGGKRQIHLMLHGAGDAVQLPDELFEFFGTAKAQFAVEEKADR